MWNASRFCVSSLRRGHANLLCIVPILVYVPPKRVRWRELVPPVYMRAAGMRCHPWLRPGRRQTVLATCTPQRPAGVMNVMEKLRCREPTGEGSP